MIAAGGYQAVLIFNRTASDACNQTLGMSVEGDLPTFGVAPREQGFAIFDVEEVVPTAYTLEVSSPGLDRPLRRLDDYRRFTGRLAKIVMREKVDGQGFFRGTIAGVEGQDVLINGDDRRTHRVPLDVISRANLEVEF